MCDALAFTKTNPLGKNKTKKDKSLENSETFSQARMPSAFHVFIRNARFLQYSWNILEPFLLVFWDHRIVVNININ